MGVGGTKEESSNGKEDIKKYVDDQLENFKSEVLNNQRSLFGSKAEIDKLRKENEDLQIKCSKLEADYLKAIESKVEVQKVTSKVSEIAVDDYVESFLSDPNVEHGYFTEKIEGIVYRKVLKGVLQAIAKSFDTAELNLMGHKITCSIRPGVENSILTKEMLVEKEKDE